MTDSRAVADYQREILRKIDEMRENLANRTCPGFMMLDKLRLWLLARGEEKKEGAK